MICTYPKCRDEATHRLGYVDGIYYCEKHVKIMRHEKVWGSNKKRRLKMDNREIINWLETNSLDNSDIRICREDFNELKEKLGVKD